MAVVVTGAAGFIGSHLVSSLARRGVTVVGIDRDPRMPPGAIPLVGDLVAPSEEIKDALAGADAVWHLAARPGVRDRSPDIERRRFLDNVCATHIVCDLVPRDVPLVFTSSSSIYGGALRSSGVRACKETDEPEPRGGYARSKLRAERACQRRMRDKGATCIARPFTVVGPGQRDDMALSIWIRSVLASTPISVFGSLNRTRDLTDVKDVVAILVALADAGLGRTVNIGTGRSHTLGEVIQAIFEVLGRESEVVAVPAEIEEVETTLADVTLLRTLTGITPRTNIRRVIAQHAHHITHQPWRNEVLV